MANKTIDELGGAGRVAFGVVPSHLAADASVDHIVFTAPKACRVRKVSWVPDAAVTGDTSNGAHFNVRTVTAAGVATERAAVDLITGENEVALVSRVAYAPAAPYRALAAGDHVSVQREKIGNGVITARLLVSIEHDLVG
jgi:hypothetical protein